MEQIVRKGGYRKIVKMVEMPFRGSRGISGRVMASGVSDDQQAELVRLRRELLSFVVADLAQVQPDG